MAEAVQPPEILLPNLSSEHYVGRSLPSLYEEWLLTKNPEMYEFLTRMIQERIKVQLKKIVSNINSSSSNPRRVAAYEQQIYDIYQEPAVVYGGATIPFTAVDFRNSILEGVLLGSKSDQESLLHIYVKALVSTDVLMLLPSHVRERCVRSLADMVDSVMTDPNQYYTARFTILSTLLSTHATKLDGKATYKKYDVVPASDNNILTYLFVRSFMTNYPQFLASALTFNQYQYVLGLGYLFGFFSDGHLVLLADPRDFSPEEWRSALTSVVLNRDINQSGSGLVIRTHELVKHLSRMDTQLDRLFYTQDSYSLRSLRQLSGAFERWQTALKELDAFSGAGLKAATVRYMNATPSDRSKRPTSSATSSDHQAQPESVRFDPSPRPLARIGKSESEETLAEADTAPLERMEADTTRYSPDDVIPQKQRTQASLVLDDGSAERARLEMAVAKPRTEIARTLKQLFGFYFKLPEQYVGGNNPEDAHFPQFLMLWINSNYQEVLELIEVFVRTPNIGLTKTDTLASLDQFSMLSSENLRILYESVMSQVTMKRSLLARQSGRKHYPNLRRLPYSPERVMLLVQAVRRRVIEQEGLPAAKRSRWLLLLERFDHKVGDHWARYHDREQLPDFDTLKNQPMKEISHEPELFDDFVVASGRFSVVREKADLTKLQMVSSEDPKYVEDYTRKLAGILIQAKVLGELVQITTSGEIVDTAIQWKFDQERLGDEERRRRKTEKIVVHGSALLISLFLFGVFMWLMTQGAEAFADQESLSQTSLLFLLSSVIAGLGFANFFTVRTRQANQRFAEDVYQKYVARLPELLDKNEDDIVEYLKSTNLPGSEEAYRQYYRETSEQINSFVIAGINAVVIVIIIAAFGVDAFFNAKYGLEITGADDTPTNSTAVPMNHEGSIEPSSSPALFVYGQDATTATLSFATRQLCHPTPDQSAAFACGVPDAFKDYATPYTPDMVSEVNTPREFEQTWRDRSAQPQTLVHLEENKTRFFDGLVGFEPVEVIVLGASDDLAMTFNPFFGTSVVAGDYDQLAIVYRALPNPNQLPTPPQSLPVGVEGLVDWSNPGTSPVRPLIESMADAVTQQQAALAGLTPPEIGAALQAPIAQRGWLSNGDLIRASRDFAQQAGRRYELMEFDGSVAVTQTDMLLAIWQTSGWDCEMNTRFTNITVRDAAGEAGHLFPIYELMGESLDPDSGPNGYYGHAVTVYQEVDGLWYVDVATLPANNNVSVLPPPDYDGQPAQASGWLAGLFESAGDVFPGGEAGLLASFALLVVVGPLVTVVVLRRRTKRSKTAARRAEVVKWFPPERTGEDLSVSDYLLDDVDQPLDDDSTQVSHDREVASNENPLIEEDDIDWDAIQVAEEESDADVGFDTDADADEAVNWQEQQAAVRRVSDTTGISPEMIHRIEKQAEFIAQTDATELWSKVFMLIDWIFDGESKAEVVHDLSDAGFVERMEQRARDFITLLEKESRIRSTTLLDDISQSLKVSLMGRHVTQTLRGDSHDRATDVDATILAESFGRDPLALLQKVAGREAQVYQGLVLIGEYLQREKEALDIGDFSYTEGVVRAEGERQQSQPVEDEYQATLAALSVSSEEAVDDDDPERVEHIQRAQELAEVLKGRYQIEDKLRRYRMIQAALEVITLILDVADEAGSGAESSS